MQYHNYFLTFSLLPLVLVGCSSPKKDKPQRVVVAPPMQQTQANNTAIATDSTTERVEQKQVTQKEVVTPKETLKPKEIKQKQIKPKPPRIIKVKKPPQPQANAIGGYANGCIKNPVELSAKGTGYIDMRRHRERYYGHPRLIKFIGELGKYTAKRHGKKHLIGDLSQDHGGKMPYGHSSHQIGLDVDIWMQTVAKNAYVNPDRDMQTIVDKVDMSILGGKIDRATRDALHFSATHNDVARIFVNPVVKWNLCQTETNKSWLRKLRPWWGHDQHFHVRLNCPDSSQDCKDQNPIPQGSGCDADLYNWVDEQSGLITGRIKPKPKKKTTKKPKVPPEQCQWIQ